MKNIILTSSFGTVARELFEQGSLPAEPCRVAFIVTAGNIYVEKPWMENDRKALIDLGYDVRDVDFEKYEDLNALQIALAVADILFVAGGNTTYLNKYAQRSGFSKLIYDLLDKGKIYIGSSAGSILAGPSVAPFTKEDAEELPTEFVAHDPSCLSLVPYVILPHYPKYATSNDRIADTHKDEFPFVKLTDDEYRIETYTKRDAL